MIHIFTALKPEAQAFVDKYKLKKEKIDNYTIYSNDTIILIITGVGIQKMQMGCEFIIQKYKSHQDDLFLNIGICGARENYPIGSLIEIGKLHYKNLNLIVDERFKNTLTCLDTEAIDDTYELVDMESYGFYKATYDKYSNIYIFKVVSDHFKPETVTKEKTKSLIFNTIELINEKIQQ